MATTHSDATATKSQKPPSTSTQVKQFENLKTLLKNAKTSAGQDLYAHLQDVFKKLILHYPD